MIDILEHSIFKIPLLNRSYLKRVNKLKRHFCLFLQRFGLLKPFTFKLSAIICEL